MGREWQQKSVKEFVMPDAVYYQSLWAVRDLDRMRKRVEELNEDIEAGLKGSYSVHEAPEKYNISKPTERQAMEKIMLQDRVNAINNAMENVPDTYRDYIMESIIYHITPKKCYPDNIWRIWKQRFLYNVAKNLCLI